MFKKGDFIIMAENDIKCCTFTAETSMYTHIEIWQFNSTYKLYRIVNLVRQENCGKA